jgi:hypothetical protein
VSIRSAHEQRPACFAAFAKFAHCHALNGVCANTCGSITLLHLALLPCACVLCVPMSRSCAQNAECVALFPAPLPLPGFYASSLTEFPACVPSIACPGMDAPAVASAYTQLLGSDALDALLLGWSTSGSLVVSVS